MGINITSLGFCEDKNWLEHEKCLWDFPGGPVVMNPPSTAGDAGSIPGWGTKIPHAVGQLSPHPTATELVHLNERARVPQTTEPTCSGARTPQLERSPAPQRRTCAPATKDPTCLNRDPTCLNRDPACRN